MAVQFFWLRYQGVPMAKDPAAAPAERVPAIRPDYLLVADSVPGLIGVIGPDGAVESCNRAVLEYFGATLEEIQGWASSKLVHPDDIPDVIAAQKRARETGEDLLDEHRDRKSTRLNSSHSSISYAVFCLKKKKKTKKIYYIRKKKKKYKKKKKKKKIN